MNLKPASLQRPLLKWFDCYGRKSLPWQLNKTPYRVWLSEIMLQQTQVSTVIPYFEQFTLRFPDLESLSQAHEDAVLHLWAGLGYYSRARNLHRAAKLIMEKYAGEFPTTLPELQSLPGIGPSTAGAILAIAFNQPAAILDGNVKRVITRLHGIQEPINEKATETLLWKLARHYTPTQRVADYTQAMMDLGATLCTRSKPECKRCPLKKRCVAHKLDMTTFIPAKKTTRRIPTRTATFLILKKGQQILLYKRPASGVWGSLFSLPEIAGKPDFAAITDFCQQHYQFSPRTHQSLKPFRHTFTHYHLHIFPVVLELKKTSIKFMEESQQIWYNLETPKSIGLPKPIQSILQGLR